MRNVILIAVVCAIGLGREAGCEPLSLCGLRSLLVLGALAVTCMTARLIVLASVPLTSTLQSQWVPRLRTLHGGVWLVATAFLIFIVDWVTIVRTNWLLDQTVLIDDLVILIPLLLPWLISWAVFYDLEPDAGSNGLTSELNAGRARLRFVVLHVRLVLGVGVLPVLSICLVKDVAHQLWPEILSSRWAPGLYILPLAVMVLCYPWFLFALWDTARLQPSVLRNRLLTLTKRHRLPIADFFVWKTDGRVSNAVVTGVLPWLRYVFFSDRLLAELTDQEIECALAHELGHVRHQHLLKRLAALLLPLFVCLVAAALGRWTAASVTDQPVSGDNTVAVYALLTGTLGYVWLGLGWYSRQLEHQADLWACQNLSDNRPGFALAAYVRVLAKLTADSPAHGRGWLHPGWHERRDFLAQAVLCKSVAERFSRQIDTVGYCLLLAALAGLAAFVAF